MMRLVGPAWTTFKDVEAEKEPSVPVTVHRPALWEVYTFCANEPPFPELMPHVVALVTSQKLPWPSVAVAVKASVEPAVTVADCGEMLTLTAPEGFTVKVAKPTTFS